MKTRIERLDLQKLELLQVNARFMRQETYVQLVENIRRDGCLTTVPFAVRVKGSRPKRYRVLSGNHRVRAAIDAGILEADVLVTDDALPRDQQVAIQLSHNAIVGEDDPAILAQLYEELEEVDWKQYAGLDDEVLKLLEEVSVGALQEANLEWQTALIVFLPEELERARACLAEALELAAGDDVWLARAADYDRTFDAIAETGQAFNTRNQATALMLVLDVFERHKTDLQAGWRGPDGEPKRDGLVPLTSILGTDAVPASTAAALARAIERLVGSGAVPADKLWLALDQLAADKPPDGAAPDPAPRGGRARPRKASPARS